MVGAKNRGVFRHLMNNSFFSRSRDLRACKVRESDSFDIVLRVLCQITVENSMKVHYFLNWSYGDYLQVRKFSNETVKSVYYAPSSRLFTNTIFY